MLKEQTERSLVYRAARYFFDQGMSQQQFADAVYDCTFQDRDLNEAIWALKDRAELDHLIQFVWTFRR